MNTFAATRRELGDLDGARQLLEQTVAAYRRVQATTAPTL